MRAKLKCGRARSSRDMHVTHTCRCRAVIQDRRSLVLLGRATAGLRLRSLVHRCLWLASAAGCVGLRLD